MSVACAGVTPGSKAGAVVSRETVAAGLRNEPAGVTASRAKVPMVEASTTGMMYWVEVAPSMDTHVGESFTVVCFFH